MTILHEPRVSSWARGHLLCRVDGVSDRVALTFDDGPSPRDTERVLDVLARHVAIHGDWHLPPPMLPPSLLRREVERSALAVKRAADVTPRHYRPPYGLMLPSQARFARELGFAPVLGDVYPEDALRPGVDRIVRRVVSRLSAGSILILHDGSAHLEMSRGQTVEALEIILQHMNSHGLRGVSVERLLIAAGAESAAPAVSSGGGSP